MKARAVVVGEIQRHIESRYPTLTSTIVHYKICSSRHLKLGIEFVSLQREYVNCSAQVTEILFVARSVGW